MIFKIFRLVVVLAVSPILIIPMFIINTIFSDDFEDWLYGWKLYFWGE